MRDELMKWRQGHVAEAGQFGLQHEHFDLAVVVSQDCDIAALLDKEPNIECVLARTVGAPDPQCLSGKNPRVLHIEYAHDATLEIDLRHRHSVPKEKLLNARSSNVEIPLPSVRVLSKWLGKRYSRPAFPDAFNRRLDAQGHRLSKLSKSAAAHDVSALFVSLDNFTEELPEDVPYQLILWVGCQIEVFEDPARRAAVEALSVKFEETLNRCPGITVLECEVRSHGEITLADLELFVKLDFDYRSAAEGSSVDE